MIDILAALEGTAVAKGTKRCKIGRWLDGIPADQPGRADLIATFEERDPLSPHYRQLDQLDTLSMALSFPTSIKTIGDHRSGVRCRCYR